MQTHVFSGFKQGLMTITALMTFTVGYAQTPDYNTVYGAGTSLHGGTNNSIFGWDAGNVNDGDYNTFLGREAGLKNTTGSYNTFLGGASGVWNTGDFNTFVGASSGEQNTTGSSNSFYGVDAGIDNLTGRNNTFVGREAGSSNTNGNFNTFIGDGAGYGNVGAPFNTYVGQNAAHNSTGEQNAFFGMNAGYFNATGSYNTFLGQCAGYMNAAGSENTFVGRFSGKESEGNYNVFVGHDAGSHAKGDRNVIVGYKTATSLEGSGHVILGRYTAGDISIAPGYRSLFVLNNQYKTSNPLLYGYFAASSDPSSPSGAILNKAQLAVNTSTIQTNMSLTVNGQMYIGDFSAGTVRNIPVEKLNKYYLWVEKGVVSENFAVAKVNDWADHVFRKDYSLMPLKDVESYVKQHKHLPNVPSEEELKKEGYDLHSMNKNFITKIEELTLYSIEQDKKIQTQQVQIEKLNSALVNYKNVAIRLDELQKLMEQKN